MVLLEKIGIRTLVEHKQFWSLSKKSRIFHNSNSYSKKSKPAINLTRRYHASRNTHDFYEKCIVAGTQVFLYSVWCCYGCIRYEHWSWWLTVVYIPYCVKILYFDDFKKYVLLPWWDEYLRKRSNTPVEVWQEYKLDAKLMKKFDWYSNFNNYRTISWLYVWPCEWRTMRIQAKFFSLAHQREKQKAYWKSLCTELHAEGYEPVCRRIGVEVIPSPRDMIEIKKYIIFRELECFCYLTQRVWKSDTYTRTTILAKPVHILTDELTEENMDIILDILHKLG